jgi:mRNA interferase HigB
MRVIAKSTLREFWTIHSDAEGALMAWLVDAQKAEWKTPNDITANYANVSLLADSRVCFNIKGNHYRLIVKVLYQAKVVYIKFVGTHAEYDEVDANTVSRY